MQIMARGSQRHDKTAIIAHDITVENDPRSGTSATPTYPTASTFSISGGVQRRPLHAVVGRPAATPR
jgi:hypothetical protein